jgi:hypothetical protein
MGLSTFYALTEVGRDPAASRTYGIANDELLPAAFFQAFRQPAELAFHRVMRAVATRKDVDASQYEVAEVLADDEEVILPGPKDTCGGGVFVKTAREVGRTPVVAWLEQLRAGEDAAAATAASKTLKVRQVMLDRAG